MKKTGALFCAALMLLLCAFPVSAENTGAMDEFTEEFLRGDIDGSGALDTVDYMMLKRSILGTYTLSAEQISRGDIDESGALETLDYMMLKRAILGTFTL